MKDNKYLTNHDITKPFPELNDLKNSIDSLIFDLDGTLLDSMTLWNEIDINFLSKRGFEVTSDYTDYVKSVSIDDAASYTKKRFNLKETPEEIKNEWNQMASIAYAKEIKVFDGVWEYLSKASLLGYKISCATALTRENARACLQFNGILEFFDSLVTLEDLSEGTNKSTPDVYLKAASTINANPAKTLVFEDVEIALLGAKLGGFKTAAVYDRIGAGTKDSWERMTNNADYCIINWNNK